MANTRYLRKQERIDLRARAIWESHSGNEVLVEGTKIAENDEYELYENATYFRNYSSSSCYLRENCWVLIQKDKHQFVVTHEFHRNVPDSVRQLAEQEHEIN